MSEVDSTVVLAVLVAMLLGGLVKGVTGIGLPVVAIGILSSVGDARLALAAISIPIVLTNLWQAWHAGRPMETVRRFWPLMVCMLTCVWLSANLVIHLRDEVLYGIIGVSVIIFAVCGLSLPDWTLPERMQVWAGPLAGALGGPLRGFSAIWGPPLVMYFVMIRLSKEAFIRTTGFIWLAASIPLVGGYLRSGILNAETAPLSALAVVPSLAGLWAGQWLRGRFDQKTFRKVLLIVFFFIGLNLIRRAL
jgi:uncharacterized membrane protein YfcA